MAYNDIQDRLYEIDKSWKNNLIFYGIPIESNLEDEDPYATEEKVRDLIKRKLRITREIPFNRVSRVFHGPEFRGHKPIQVCCVLCVAMLGCHHYHVTPPGTLC